jgi:hypothetical protein
MLRTFDKRTLLAMRTIEMSCPKDFNHLLDALQAEVDHLDNTSRTCKDDITYRWNQGATQAISDFITQARSARDILLDIRKGDEERARESQTDLKSRAIG